MNCPLCGAKLDVPLPIGRRDICPSCKADLHTCRCCTHYERGAHNDCREPQADRVVDKEASNFCDYFQLTPKAGSAAAGPSSKDKAKAALEALFKK